VWTVQHVWQELMESLHDWRLYTTDKLNPVEMAAFISVLFGLLATLIVPMMHADDAVIGRRLKAAAGESGLAHSHGGELSNRTHGASFDETLGFQPVCWAAGVVLLWTSQWWRMMLRFAFFGPLVMMVQLMFLDVALFLLLLLGPLLGFAGAFVGLYYHHEDTLDAECAGFNGNGGSLLQAYLDTLDILFEVMLGGEIPLNCLHESNLAFAGPVFMIAYLLVIVLLALNMLIAIMATTFERVRERAPEQYMFLKCLMGVSYAHIDAVPPPLNVFKLGWHGYELCQWAQKRLESKSGVKLSCGSLLGYERVDEHGKKQDETQRDDDAWKEMSTHEELREAISEHLQERGGMAGVDDDRWRASLFKELNSAKKERREASKLAAKRAAALERVQQTLERQSYAANMAAMADSATAAALARVQETLDGQADISFRAKAKSFPPQLSPRGGR